MTQQEAIKIQASIQERGFRLDYWFGTDCKKCCDVYPRLMKANRTDPCDIYYQCDVCGKRTVFFTMPWMAREAWNRGETYGEKTQYSLFD